MSEEDLQVLEGSCMSDKFRSGIQFFFNLRSLRLVVINAASHHEQAG